MGPSPFSVLKPMREPGTGGEYVAVGAPGTRCRCSGGLQALYPFTALVPLLGGSDTGCQSCWQEPFLFLWK